MSASLNNLVTAAQVLSGIKRLPNYHGASFLFQLENLDALDSARERYFQEERSRRIFDWVMQCQVITDFYGPFLPVDWGDTPFPAEVWKKLEAKAEAMTSGFVAGDYILDRIDTWLLESYALKGLCEVLPGDIVLDCGTFTGNTSLYFSQKAGSAGHVYGFEASPSTFAQYSENMRALANVTPVNAAVYDHCGTLFFAENGPGASVSAKGVSVSATTLDDFYRKNGLTRVNFIKMDVEGAEKNALEGAKDIIRTHVPKMALSAYHKEDDLIRLPDLVDSLAPGRYEFRLRHFSNCIYETVLFCVPRAKSDERPTTPAPENRPSPEDTAYLPLARLLFTTLRGMVEGFVREETPTLMALMNKLNVSAQEMRELLGVQETLQAENLALRALLEKEKARR